MGRYALSGCSNLREVTINCDYFGEWFRGNESLMEIVLGEGVTSIGHNAFSGCSNLIFITIPESVTSIGVGAFTACNNLVSITIPRNVTSIGENAFSGCSSLTSINIPKENINLLNGAFGDENVKLKVNGKARTIKSQKTSQNSIRGNLENRIKEWASPSMPTGVGVGRVVGSAVGSVN